MASKPGEDKKFEEKHSGCNLWSDPNGPEETKSFSEEATHARSHPKGLEKTKYLFLRMSPSNKDWSDPNGLEKTKTKDVTA